MEPIRLQKYLADRGLLSRRAAEDEIRTGKVKVNGIPAEIGQKIDPDCDTVEYRGKLIKPAGANYRYILLNKPRGYLSSASDDRGRKCVTDIVRVGARLYPVGRLDMDSEGLLLLTNDGDLTYKLTHPKHEIPKIYHVTLAGEVSANELDILSSPMTLDGYEILPVKTTVIEKTSDTTTLEMTLYEGRNRQIRRMCERIERKVLRLCRVAIGDIRLCDLAVGAWRDLGDDEIAYLKQERTDKNA